MRQILLDAAPAGFRVRGARGLIADRNSRMVSDAAFDGDPLFRLGIIRGRLKRLRVEGLVFFVRITTVSSKELTAYG